MTAMEIVEHDVIDSGPPKTGLEDLSLRVSGKDVAKPIREMEKPETNPVPIPAGALFNVQKRIKGDTLPPPHVEPVAWTIIIDDTAIPEDWNSLLIDATTLKLSFATSDEQVKEMYKVNRQHYDKVKAESPEVHAEIMDMFKEAKAKFKE